MINTIGKVRTKFIDRSINAYDKFNVLRNETELLKNELAMLPDNDSLVKNNRKIKYWEKILSIISCVQVTICTIQIMITPLKLIPYDNLTNELINAITLISFAFMFLSYFLSSIKDNQKNYQEERWRIYENTCFEYLEILEKVASDNQNKEEI